MALRRTALFLLVLLPGLAAVVVCGHYMFQDWSALIAAFARFERLERSGADLRALHVASTYDMVYRVNAFADGVGVMLGAILTGIGVHGLCTMPFPEARAARKASPAAATGIAIGCGAALLAVGLLCTSLVRRAGP